MHDKGDLSPSEVGARLGASTRTVQRWITKGVLPARRVGGRWRVAFDALDALEASAEPPAIRPIGHVFVANRGEIAARVRRTCDRLGIRVTIPGEAGRPPIDLLDADAVVRSALNEGAGAVHPGFGFLSENPGFADRVTDAGLVWIGPPAAAIRAMGDKAAARRLAAGLGIPVVPGYDDPDQSDATLAAAVATIGLPVIVKPAAGGGGKGMRVVRDAAELAGALATARREATAAFGDDRLILERYLEGPRHVEVQVLFDTFGQGVHLGERDCSLQRRHQKVLEETPSPAVDPRLRRRLGASALALAGAVGYVSAGTCEFLVDGERAYFLEMNTRLQVEHPVTEMALGRDLVADQLRIASGAPLGIDQAEVDAILDRGIHAVEVRLYAEDAEAGFLPATGRVEALRWPSDQDGRVRVDAGIEPGSVVDERFDPMLAKIVAAGPDRRAALDRLAAALDDTVVLGLTTNLRFLRWLVRQPVVRDGEARIDTLERIWPPPIDAATDPPDDAWAVAARLLAEAEATPDAWAGGWRLNARPRLRLTADDTGQRTVSVPARDVPSTRWAVVTADGTAHVDIDGRSVAFTPAPAPDVDRAVRRAATHHGGGSEEVPAPMPGSVLAVHVAPGAAVAPGDPLVTLEAMKMEHLVLATRPAVVLEVRVRPAEQVRRGQILVVVE
jgi:acetyl-CoA/propionyl-CoA carboxylase biotin carboxyl carrier protein